MTDGADAQHLGKRHGPAGTLNPAERLSAWDARHEPVVRAGGWGPKVLRGRKKEGGPPRIPRSVDPRRARALPVPAEAQADARMFMLGGDTIRSIKVIVDATGYDLRQARDIVYALVYDIEVPSGN